MLLPNMHFINIQPILEPPPLLPNLHIVPAHLTLPHPSIVRKSPILQAIASLPLHTIMRVLILIPELHRDLVIGKGEKLFA